jgi:hypothetical protein
VSTAYRVLVLGSKDSETAGVQVEILVPEALGSVDEESYVRHVDMRKANGNRKICFRYKDLERVSIGHNGQIAEAGHANVLFELCAECCKGPG